MFGLLFLWLIAPLLAAAKAVTPGDDVAASVTDYKYYLLRTFTFNNLNYLVKSQETRFTINANPDGVAVVRFRVGPHGAALTCRLAYDVTGRITNRDRPDAVTANTYENQLKEAVCQADRIVFGNDNSVSFYREKYGSWKVWAGPAVRGPGGPGSNTAKFAIASYINPYDHATQVLVNNAAGKPIYVDRYDTFLRFTFGKTQCTVQTDDHEIRGWTMPIPVSGTALPNGVEAALTEVLCYGTELHFDNNGQLLRIESHNRATVYLQTA